MATAETTVLLTDEEFGKRPDPGDPEELVRGRIVAMPVPDRISLIDAGRGKSRR